MTHEIPDERPRRLKAPITTKDRKFLCAVKNVLMIMPGVKGEDPAIAGYFANDRFYIVTWRFI